jgi:hypothetical protein
VLPIALGLGTICRATPAFAANAPQQGSGSSSMVWITLLLPTALIVLMIYSILRNVRSNQSTAERSIKRFDEHRQFTEEHMRRVESQIDRLDERLSRVVELLAAIEEGQRHDHA